MSNGNSGCVQRYMRVRVLKMPAFSKETQSEPLERRGMGRRGRGLTIQLLERRRHVVLFVVSAGADFWWLGSTAVLQIAAKSELIFWRSIV